MIVLATMKYLYMSILHILNYLMDTLSSTFLGNTFLETHRLRSLFIALNDEVFEIREKTISVIGR